MGIVTDSADKAFRDFTVDGVPSSGANNPRKSEVRAVFRNVENSISAAADGIVQFARWSELSSVAGTRRGQAGRVIGPDTGEHVDPVVGGSVENEGEYSWSTSPAGWRRVGATTLNALKSGLDDVTTSTQSKEPRNDSFSSEWEYAVFHGESGRVLFGFPYEAAAPYLGAAVVPLQELGFSAHWYRALFDPSTGEVIEGIRWDGSRFPEVAASPNLLIYEEGQQPNRSIRGNIDGVFAAIAGGDGDHFAPTASNLDARWIARAAGSELLMRDRLRTETAFAQARLVHIPAYGQSLGAGRTNGVAINSAATSPGKALMFPTGIRVFGQEHLPALSSAILDRQTLDPFVNAREQISGNGGETGFARMAASLTASGKAYATDAVLASTSAIGGTVYTGLKKGTRPYFNLIQSICRAKLVADLLGKSYVVPYVVFIHGEADRALSVAEYQAILEQLQHDLDTDIKSVTGQSSNVVLVVDQMSSWTVTSSGTATSGVPLAQLQAAVANPGKILCVGPKYQYAYVDGQHLDAVGYADNGERIARAINAGPAWRPLHPISATRSGTTITVNFHVPNGALTIDTTLVSNPGELGLRFAETGGSSTKISSVAIASANSLNVILDSEPSGTAQRIEFGLTGAVNTPAGRTTGPRICLRDSSTDVSSEGTRLYNWCAHSQISVS